MKRTLSVVISILILSFLFASCKENPTASISSAETDQPILSSTELTEPESEIISQTETVSPTEATYYQSEVDTFEIETPYGVLQYPEMWKNKVIVEQNDGSPYTVSFLVQKGEETIRLFDILFGESPDAAAELGTMDTASGAVRVSLLDYSGEAVSAFSENEREDIYAMAEDLNVVISGLVHQYGLSRGEDDVHSSDQTENNGDSDVFEIETPYAVLQYPLKWKDIVSIEQSGNEPYVVSFSVKNGQEIVALFDLLFGDCPEGAFELGVMRTADGSITVSVADHSENAVNAFPEDERSEIYEMSEDMNVLISGLVSDYGLVLR